MGRWRYTDHWAKARNEDLTIDGVVVSGAFAGAAYGTPTTHAKQRRLPVPKVTRVALEVIRARRAAGESLTAIGRAYGCSGHYIAGLLSGKVKAAAAYQCSCAGRRGGPEPRLRW